MVQHKTYLSMAQYNPYLSRRNIRLIYLCHSITLTYLWQDLLIYGKTYLSIVQHKTYLSMPQYNPSFLWRNTLTYLWRSIRLTYLWSRKCSWDRGHGPGSASLRRAHDETPVNLPVRFQGPFQMHLLFGPFLWIWVRVWVWTGHMERAQHETDARVVSLKNVF